MIKLKNISKSFKNEKVLDDLSLDLNEVGFVIITGESGCGKTTLINIISGIEKQDNGELIIDEANYIYNDNINSEIAYLSQKQNLLEKSTVYENIYEVLTINNFDGNYDQRINELTKIVNLNNDLINRKVNSLSTGEAQRLAIAIALARNSKTIILDEATENLDYKNALNIYNVLSNISKDRLVILVTHDIKNAIKFSDKLVTIHDGKAYIKNIYEKKNDGVVLDNNSNIATKPKKHLIFRLDFLNLLFIIYAILILLIVSNINVRNNPKKINKYSNYIYTSSDKLSIDDLEYIHTNDEYDFYINSNSDYYVDYTKNNKKINIIKGSDISNNNEIIISNHLSNKNDLIYNIGKIIKLGDIDYKIVGIFKSDNNVVLIDINRNNELLSAYYETYNYYTLAINDNYYSSYNYYSYNKTLIHDTDIKLNRYVTNIFIDNNKTELDVSLYVPLGILVLILIFNTMIILLYNNVKDPDIVFYRLNGLRKKDIRKKLCKKMYLIPIVFSMASYIIIFLILCIIMNDKQVCYRVDNITFLFGLTSILLYVIYAEARNIITINKKISKIIK